MGVKCIDTAYFSSIIHNERVIMSKKAYVGIVILALLLGFFIGYCLLLPTWQIPSQFKYDVLKDTLTIALAVLAVGIAVIGSAIYLIVLGQLQAKTTSIARVEAKKGSVRLFIHAGFVFWESYDRAAKKELTYLEVAIGLTERALNFYYQIPSKEAEDRETQRSFCLIRNNLAYYFALRKRPEDKDLAREYADYIRERVSDYAEDRANWLDTYDFVKSQYPD